MDHLPKDPDILASTINFLLRDEEFDTLDEICYCYNVPRPELEANLARAGYRYDPVHKCFK
jgi:hypothetical protein